MERAAFTIYLIILILCILLFGAMHTYVYTLMALGVLTATVLIFVKKSYNYVAKKEGNYLVLRCFHNLYCSLASKVFFSRNS